MCSREECTYYVLEEDWLKLSFRYSKELLISYQENWVILKNA